MLLLAIFQLGFLHRTDTSDGTPFREDLPIEHFLEQLPNAHKLSGTLGFFAIVSSLAVGEQGRSIFRFDKFEVGPGRHFQSHRLSWGFCH